MLSANEYLQMSRLPPASQRHYFYQHWTLREACVKALGTGLWAENRPLSFLVDGPEAIEPEMEGRIRGDEKDWLLRLFYPTGNHIVAAALQSGNGPEMTISLDWFRFPENNNL